MRALLVVALSTFSLNALAYDGYLASNGVVYPWCTQNAVDPDNDGWGWENDQTCKVWKEMTQPEVTEETHIYEYGEGPRKIRLTTAEGARRCGNSIQRATGAMPECGVKRVMDHRRAVR